MSATGGASTVEQGRVRQDEPQGDPVPQPGPRPRATTEEVRVAMALNGGVSLAVWMGGCAVELDAARRAHLGEEDLRVARLDPKSPDKAPVLAAEKPGDRRTIYHAMCEAFDRQLVIDLMSGSSAGGINGALLGAAITGRRRLHPDFIRGKWLTLGDFETLMHKLQTPSPTSLMGGHAFFEKLRRTFDELLPEEQAVPSPQKPDKPTDKEKRAKAEWDDSQRLLQLPENQAARRDELLDCAKLDVTATDVEGHEHRFRDTWGEELVASEYRQRFCFRKPDDFTAERLATAARSSASFPLAFEPWAVDGELLGLEKEKRRWLIDGGLLDNAPIRAVLDLVPARSAERPVKRFLCYLNADPPIKPSFDVDAELTDANDPTADVKPAKKRGKKQEAKPARPQLQDVVGYMVGLPRKASFVDQMTAVQHAVSRSTTVDRGLSELLGLQGPTLEATASALFRPYRSRRRLAALEDLLEQPSDVSVAAERLAVAGPTGEDRELAWIPRTLDIPVHLDGRPDTRWGWGARAAERVLFLTLDLIRERLDAGGLVGAEQARLVQARSEIYDGLAALEETHEGLVSDPKVVALVTSLATCDPDEVDAVLCALRCLMTAPDRDPQIRSVVECAARTTFRVRLLLGSVANGAAQNGAGGNGASEAAPSKITVAEALFGAGAEQDTAEFDADALHAFLTRVLRIEVVRRAYSADEVVESEQPLAFAQLTPCAPGLLYAEHPLHPGDEVPAKPDDKLTGTRWGHFAGFYRESWRANDFMWGRLDGAVRIVDMLLDSGRGSSELVPGTKRTVRANTLAEALVPADAFGGGDDLGGERRWLVAEALADAEPVPEADRFRERDVRHERIERLLHEDCDRDAFLNELAEKIEQDLSGDLDGQDRGALTRALCVRGAQWEVLRRELEHVVRTSADDVGLGTSVHALPVVPGNDQTWRQALEEQRKATEPLPRRLGVDDEGEQASALMIRTASRGALIGLSAMRETNLPGAAALVLPRALLLPIAGMVTKRWWPYPFVVSLAFWAFALVVAARMITLETGGADAWDAERWLAVGTTLLAAVGVGMVCLVPLWRFARGSKFWRRTGEALALVALVTVGGGLAVGWLLLEGFALSTVLGQSGAATPWAWASGVAVAVLGIYRFLPHLPYGKLRPAVEWLLRRPWRGALSLLAFFVPWVALGVWAVFFGSVLDAARGVDPPVVDGVEREWGTRERVSAVVALVLPFLVAFGYVMLSVQRRAGTIISKRAFKA